MEEEDKKEAVEKAGVDYDKLKEIITTVYPVRYERRTAIAPVLWICGAMFTTSLIWCTVNMGLTNDSDYKTTVMSFALSVAGLSFLVAIATVILIVWRSKEVKDEKYNPRWDLLRSEHFLLEMQRLLTTKNGTPDNNLLDNNVTDPAPVKVNNDKHQDNDGN